MEARDKVVIILGNSVSFNSVAINAYYNLAPVENDEFTQYNEEQLNWDEVLGTLCKPGAQWTIRVDEALSFLRGDLSQFCKAWFYF